jgi:hypothetical protein
MLDADVPATAVAEVVRFIGGNDHFFLTWRCRPASSP